MSDEHTLVICDDGDEGMSYFLEHPDGCPYDPDDSFVADGKFYTCGPGSLWYEAGKDTVADIETLQPGRHAVRMHVEHTPSLSTNGGEEWDAWLEVVT